MTNDEKADYIAKRLVEVKGILDDIAEHTGEVMVVFPEGVAMFFAALGQSFQNFILKTHDLLADRLVLANEFRAKEMKGETK